MLGNKDIIIEWLSGKDNNSIFEITEKQEKTVRSNLQNKFYWDIVVKTIANFHWMTVIESHLAIKSTLGIETTTDLSTKEFKEMIEIIQDLWQQNFWVIIPNPRDIADEENLFNTLWF